MNRNELRIVFMGTPEFAVAPLEALYQAGFHVVGVVTVADKPAGRGRQLQQSAVKKWAVDHSIPVLQPLKLKDEQFISDLKAWNADLFVVVAFRMLPEIVWSLPPMGTFNLHASLLPQYRGAAPINHAIINGEPITGLTTFLLDEQLDTGAILFQQEMKIGNNETASQLHDRMMPVGGELVVKTCDALMNSSLVPVKQDNSQGVLLREAPKIFKENCLLQWDQPVELIRNRIRGLSSYPGAFTHLVSPEGETLVLKIFNGEVGSGSVTKPGELDTDGKSYLAISCSDGWYKASEVQLSGRKRMGIAEFLRGIQLKTGWRIEWSERK